MPSAALLTLANPDRISTVVTATCISVVFSIWIGFIVIWKARHAGRGVSHPSCFYICSAHPMIQYRGLLSGVVIEDVAPAKIIFHYAEVKKTPIKREAGLAGPGLVKNICREEDVARTDGVSSVKEVPPVANVGVRSLHSVGIAADSDRSPWTHLFMRTSRKTSRTSQTTPSLPPPPPSANLCLSSRIFGTSRQILLQCPVPLHHQSRHPEECVPNEKPTTRYLRSTTSSSPTSPSTQLLLASHRTPRSLLDLPWRRFHLGSSPTICVEPAIQLRVIAQRASNFRKPSMLDERLIACIACAAQWFGDTVTPHLRNDYLVVSCVEGLTQPVDRMTRYALNIRRMVHVSAHLYYYDILLTFRNFDA